MQSAVTLRAIRHFVAAAEHENIHRAAEAINITQPALSRSIKDLEDVLGVDLFDRKRKRIAITDVGKLYLKFSRDILALVEEAENSARRLSNGQAGSLKVGAVEVALRSPIMKEALRRFNLSKPQVRLDLSPALPIPLPERLSAGTIDIAFITNCSAEHLNKLEESGFKYVSVGALKYNLAIPSDHPLCRRDEITAKDLDGIEIIWMLPDIAPETTKMFVETFRQHGIKVDMMPFAASEYSRYQLVSSGIGVTLITSSFENYHHDKVVFRSIANFDFSIRLLMIWRDDDEGPLVRDFVHSIFELIAGNHDTGLVLT